MHRFKFHIRPSLLWANALLLLALLSPAGQVRAADIATEVPRMQAEVPEVYTSPTNGLGSWIWETQTLSNQTCQLWREFEIPKTAKVTKARLVMTVDNEFTLYLDGLEVGHGAEWRELFIFDVSQLLQPGRHVLAVKCYNGSFFAGMLFGLQVDLADGQTIEIKSDESWRIVPEPTKGWQKQFEAQPDWPRAGVKAPLAGSPWWTEPAAINMMPSLQPPRIFFWQKGWFQVALGSVCALVILLSLRLMAQLALHQKERFLLQGERARIARDIHDDIGARMTQLVLYGEVAQNKLTADSETREQLGWICEEARGLLSTMDEILWAVNPQRDTLRDFATYVCKYARKFLETTQIQGLFEVDSNLSAEKFDLPLRRSLLMAIKETLNNAVKHSAATELRLRILCQDQQLGVVVQDNGKGFDPALATKERNGLTNMSQRMSELGGKCLITSQPGKGCRVEFIIPLKHPHWPPWNWLWNTQYYLQQTNKTRNALTKEPSQIHDPTKC